MLLQSAARDFKRLSTDARFVPSRSLSNCRERVGFWGVVRSIWNGLNIEIVEVMGTEVTRGGSWRGLPAREASYGLGSWRAKCEGAKVVGCCLLRSTVCFLLDDMDYVHQHTVMIGNVRVGGRGGGGWRG